ncbi:bacterial Ig-like domain protein [Kordia sp. SMS9]|uniref:Ig-like domain-containing protein n=1 Tax=Kordia sp. SMS9 TaxID=2282170 RepID=UPI000E0D7892|nr:Ig-like domain-containing protein [Kordia sp. SMS9]AXG69358.1 bacterial Ig-like domain protein [Kordia sp. SMS9]
MKQRVIYFSLVVLIFLSLVNCAKRGIPTGGEPDKTPPKMVKAQPAEFSTNFDEKRIRIYFDEYIKVKDIQKQLIISPPIKDGGYIVYPQGSASKYIDIQITDTLQENTTYSFNFGQSIVDNNEDNPYDYFKYVFSTGPYIDSLEVSGTIKDAVNRKPEQFVSVMLYEIDSTYNDSTIYKKTPTYITNTLDSLTEFKLSNLRAGTYKMVALKDIANNYQFNPITDKIGFVEQEVTIPTDSFYTITLFKEVPEFRATRPAQISKNMIAFGYEGVVDSMKITINSDVPDNFRFKTTRHPEKDTLRYWFENLKPETDSLLFTVSSEDYRQDFTVKLKDMERDSMKLATNHRGIIPPNDYFKVSSNTPIVAIDKSTISIQNKDSIAVEFTAKLNEKENSLELFFEKKESQRYNIQMLPKTITDFYGEVNDTLKYSLNTKPNKEYGNIELSYPGTAYPIIIQIVNEKLELIAEQYITEPKPSYNFPYIDPQFVYFRVIYDTNKNGKWDTGNYLEKIQPEVIKYFPKKVEIRANWDVIEVLSKLK